MWHKPCRQSVRGNFQPVVTPQGGGPENTTAPQLTGIAQVGQTLTYVPGVWTGIPEPTVDVITQRSPDGSTGWVGVSAGNYTLLAGDEGYYFRTREEATNADGSAFAYSSVRGPVTVGGGVPSDSYSTPDGEDYFVTPDGADYYQQP